MPLIVIVAFVGGLLYIRPRLEFLDKSATDALIKLSITLVRLAFILFFVGGTLTLLILPTTGDCSHLPSIGTTLQISKHAYISLGTVSS